MNLKSKNTNRMLLKRMSLLLILVLFFTAPFAQGGGPGTTGLDEEVDNTGAVPIDGGLSLVFAAGLGYGAKKIRDYNKKKREEEELDRVEL